MANHPVRKHLPHEIPNWVDDGALFFITICARNRGRPILTTEKTATGLIKSARHYHDIHRWFVHLFVVMPDHIHALMSFPRDEVMRKTVAHWKSYTAKKYGFRWQTNFFDHRLRSDESHDDKAFYIRENPVRANLVDSAEDWPYVWSPEQR